MLFPFLFPLKRRIGRLAGGMMAAVALIAALPAFAQDNGVRWEFRGNRNDRFVSSPAIGPDGTIYVGVLVETTSESGLLLAIDPANGNEKWFFPTPNGGIDSSPAVGSDGTVYVGCADGNLYAVNPITGKEIWRFSAAPHAIFGAPVIGKDGTIFFGTSNISLTNTESLLFAVSPQGRELWRKSASHWIYGSPAIGADGTVYYGSRDETVYAVDPVNGSEKWRFGLNAAILGTPAIGADGTIYIGSLAAFWALTPEGTRKWSFPVAGATAGAAIGPSGLIYFGAFDANLYALKPEDGTVAWSFQADQAIETTPLIRADGTVIFGANDGFVRALDYREGAFRWEFRTEGEAQSSAVVSPLDGRIFFGSRGARFYALNGNGSKLSEYSSWPMFGREVTHRAQAIKRTTDSRLVNLSTSGEVGPGRELIVGFVVRGAFTKYYLVRAVGPGLGDFGIPSPLRDPAVILKVPGQPDLFNNNWEDAAPGPTVESANLAAGAFPFVPGSKDAALVPLLVPADYTAQVLSADGSMGTALVEAYDVAVAAPGASLVNLSTRGRAGTGANILIAGLVITGTEPIRVLIRVVGPGLTAFNVPGVLARPTMTVYAQGGAEIHRNSGWTAEGRKGDLSGAASLAGAFQLSENNPDCAAVLTLNPGSYTIHAAGLNNTTGEALVEVYVAR